MTTFQDARAFLLKHRTDYDAAVKGFRWPDPVPFNWALDWFGRGKAKAVVATQDQVAKFVGLGGDKLVRIVVGAAQTNEGWLPFEDAAKAPEAFTPDGPTKADDPMLLYFTSGTTAKPKLVRHSQRSYPVGQLTTTNWLELQPGDIHLNISSPGVAKHAYSCF